MSKNNMAIAQTYYTAIAGKDITGVEKCLHPDVTFSAPIAKMNGKIAVLEGTKNFMTMFTSYTVRAVCESNDQVMLAYDILCPSPIGLVPTAALLTFQEQLVIKIELFYDARPFI